MTSSTSAAADPKLADTWEDEGHLFCGSHRPIECLLCGIKHSKWKGEPCESNKEGVWTEKGIDYILTSLREADDWETRRIVNQTAEVIMQLQKALEATEAERAKRDRMMADDAKRMYHSIHEARLLYRKNAMGPNFESAEKTMSRLEAHLLTVWKTAALKEQETGK